MGSGKSILSVAAWSQRCAESRAKAAEDDDEEDEYDCGDDLLAVLAAIEDVTLRTMLVRMVCSYSAPGGGGRGYLCDCIPGVLAELGTDEHRTEACEALCETAAGADAWPSSRIVLALARFDGDEARLRALTALVRCGLCRNADVLLVLGAFERDACTRGAAELLVDSGCANVALDEAGPTYVPRLLALFDDDTVRMAVLATLARGNWRQNWCRTSDLARLVEAFACKEIGQRAAALLRPDAPDTRLLQAREAATRFLAHAAPDARQRIVAGLNTLLAPKQRTPQLVLESAN